VKLRLLDIGRVARSKGPVSSGQAEAALLPLVGRDEPSCGTSKNASPRRSPGGVKRSRSFLKAAGAGWVAPAARRNDAARQAGDEADQGSPSSGAIHAAKASSSACSSHRPRSFARARPASRTRFGKMVKLQEAENQIVIDYQVYARRPNDSDILIAAIDVHQALLGRTTALGRGRRGVLFQ